MECWKLHLSLLLYVISVYTKFQYNHSKIVEVWKKKKKTNILYTGRHEDRQADSSIPSQHIFFVGVERYETVHKGNM